MRREKLAGFAARLADEGCYGAFARHVLRRLPDAEVPVVGDAFAVGGPLHRRFEVAFTWIFARTTAETAALIEALVAEHGALQIYVKHELRPPAPRWSADLLMECARAPSRVTADAVVQLDASTLRSRFHPAIAERLPPPPVWQRFGFRYRGLVRDGIVVAVLETTVDDGHHVAIQQVFTAPDRRGQGLGKALVGRVVTELVAGSRRALWLCADDNPASIALAKSVGFADRMRLGVLQTG